MPVNFVTGSFSADDQGFFVPHPTQVDVDSGLPEWTLDAASTRAHAERHEHDDEHNIDSNSDNDEFLTAPEGNLSRPRSDRQVEEEEEGGESTTLDSDITSSITSSNHNSPTESSSALTTEDSWDNHLSEPAVRPATPPAELYARLGRLTIDNHRHHLRMRTQQSLGILDLGLPRVDDGNGIPDLEQQIPRPLPFPGTRPPATTTVRIRTPLVCPHRARMLLSSLCAHHHATRAAERSLRMNVDLNTRNPQPGILAILARDSRRYETARRREAVMRDELGLAPELKLLPMPLTGTATAGVGGVGRIGDMYRATRRNWGGANANTIMWVEGVRDAVEEMEGMGVVALEGERSRRERGGEGEGGRGGGVGGGLCCSTCHWVLALS